MLERAPEKLSHLEPNKPPIATATDRCGGNTWLTLNRPFPSSPGPMYQNEVKCSAFMEMIFHSHANKTHFHKKGCALGLILKVRVFETRSGLLLMVIVVQLNLSTTATLGTEECGHFKEVLNKSQYMDFLSAGTK